MTDKPWIGVTDGLTLPAGIRAAFKVRMLGPPAGEVDARLILTGREGFFAWSRVNPQVPTLAIEGDKVLALGFLGGRFVPLTGTYSDDMVRLLGGVLQATGTLRAEEIQPQARLSQRERQVIEQLLYGQPIAVIAENLGIAESTVRHYLANARYKLNAPSLTVVLLKAARYGLIDWPPLPTEASKEL